uniref:Uncharacterized protein n=1 Tax=Coptotermes formosanus TaxID=36987 RepID=R4ULB9_COPFO|nr:hypothetical protein [Coptotermes formosanus]
MKHQRKKQTVFLKIIISLQMTMILHQEMKYKVHWKTEMLFQEKIIFHLMQKTLHLSKINFLNMMNHKSTNHSLSKDQILFC